MKVLIALGISLILLCIVTAGTGDDALDLSKPGAMPGVEVLSVGPVSPNAARIAELSKVQESALLQIGQAQDQIAQLQQFIEAKRIELFKAQGAIEELQRQDRLAAEQAAKEKK